MIMFLDFFSRGRGRDFFCVFGNCMFFFFSFLGEGCVFVGLGFRLFFVIINFGYG